MNVSLVYSGIRGEAIQVAVAFDVIDPHPLGPFDNNIERMVVMRSVLLFQFYQFPCAGFFGHGLNFLPCTASISRYRIMLNYACESTNRWLPAENTS